MMWQKIAVVSLSAVLLSACVDDLKQPADAGGHHHGPMAGGAQGFPLFDNLGTHHHKISTGNAKAQAYFDQGYRLLFNFNHGAAISSFKEAARLDENCAMCWWGVSFAYGPNINMPMMPDAQAPALEALKKAQTLAAHGSDLERAYIDALAARYSDDPKAERAALDQAFAGAMKKVAERYPKDLDAQVLYAESLMDTSPWDYWKPDRRTAKSGYEDLVPGIERVLRVSPKHPGAIHLYIHAVEATRTPGRAEKYADTLGSLLPGAGHLVHMPTHIYNRIGRYEDGVIWNQKAALADENYIDATQDRGMYAAMYYVHNLHFVWTASTNEGRSALAQEYARKVVSKLDPAMVKALPSVQIFVPTELFAKLRFGDWQGVLAAPAPDRSLALATALWHYARARAFASTNQIDKAVAESLLIGPSFGEDDAKLFQNFGVPGVDLVRIAGHVARAEIARARGDIPGTINELRDGVKAQDNLPYTEPPWWDFPTRQFLGAALMRAHRYDEAATVYRDDLKEWPNNGWSLFGLSQALSAQGHKREAQKVLAQYRNAWRRADVKLSESRF